MIRDSGVRRPKLYDSYSVALSDWLILTVGI